MHLFPTHCAHPRATGIACEPGKFGEFTGATRPDDCTMCPKGHWSGGWGSASCQPGNRGHYITNNANDIDGIGIEEGGTFSLVCPAGQYNPEVEQYLCQSCPRGKTSNTSGISCESCPGGKYAAFAGAPECLPCDRGSIAMGKENVACTKCNEDLGYTSEPGSTICDVCRIGFYQVDTSCTKCDDEYMICKTEGIELNSLILRPGWFRFGAKSEDAYECASSKSCPGPGTNMTSGGATYGDALCAGGYEGPLCNRSVWSRSL